MGHIEILSKHGKLFEFENNHVPRGWLAIMNGGDFSWVAEVHVYQVNIEKNFWLKFWMKRKYKDRVRFQEIFNT